MRHRKKFNHLSRPAAHRKALLANLAKSLILHKQIKTTVPKAKALRKFVEPILTKAKQDTTHARRTVFAHFQDKVPVKELFNEIAPRITDRPGGYTRIIRLGNRLGDNAELCMIELVDYNKLLQKESKPTKVKTRRSRGKAKATGNAEPGKEKSTEVSESSSSEATTPITKNGKTTAAELQDSKIQTKAVKPSSLEPTAKEQSSSPSKVSNGTGKEKDNAKQQHKDASK